VCSLRYVTNMLVHGGFLDHLMAGGHLGLGGSVIATSPVVSTSRRTVLAWLFRTLTPVPGFAQTSRMTETQYESMDNNNEKRIVVTIQKRTLGKTSVYVRYTAEAKQVEGGV